MYNKPVNDYLRFDRDIKGGGMPPVVLLSGKEQYLIEWAEKKIRARYVAEGMEVLDSQTLDPESGVGEMIEAFETLPVMSEKRVVLIRDHQILKSSRPAGENKGDLEDLGAYLEHPNESVIAVFSSSETDGRSAIVKKIKKAGASYVFDELDEKSLLGLIAKRVKAGGNEIDRRSAEYLIEETGYYNKESDYDLFDLDNDIRKLTALSGGEPITREAISESVEGDSETFIFDMLDGISGNDKRKAFEILNNRLTRDSRSGMQMIGAVVSQLEVMYETKEYMERESLNASEISRRTGLNEWRLKKISRYVNRYDLPKLKEMLRSAYALNAKVVEGEMD